MDLPKKVIGQRTDLIEALNNKLESVVNGSQKQLLEMILSDFVDELDTENGRIKNTLRNQRLVALLDKTFQDYAGTDGAAIAKSIVDATKQIIDFNHRYYSLFDKPATLNPITKQVTASVSSWLGIDSDGSTSTNGYLDTLVKVDELRHQVKDLAFGKVISQAGYSDTKKAIKDFLTDSDDGTGTLGALKKYYRNFTFDLYSTVDRTVAKINADKLDLKYAIYEGGLIKTSRKFCIERNGKVFTSEEISQFDPKEAKPPDYVPEIMLGGYGCRHHLSYIPYAVAVSLRPDLKTTK